MASVTGDHWLACLPLAHIGGLAVVTRALVTGTRLTVLPRFEPGEVEAAARQGATLVSLVATALARIDPTLFRTIVLGGAAPPVDRPPNTVATYGMTETGSGVVYDGLPLDGVDVRVDGDGEIQLRGPMLLRSYRDGRDPLTDGWFATGDLGRWLPDGRLHVDGRRSELIISGGENVWPEPVERALRSDPRVADVAVSGTPDPEWGQIVTAYVVPSGHGGPDARRPPPHREGGVAGILRTSAALRGRRHPPNSARQAATNRATAHWTARAALGQSGRQAGWFPSRTPPRTNGDAFTAPHADPHVPARRNAGLPVHRRRRSPRRMGTTSAIGSAARWAGVRPPHTPSVSPASSAWLRHRARTGQRWQTSTARSK